MPRFGMAVACITLGLMLGLGWSTPGWSDLLIRLKDGQTITVPVSPDEVKAIEFTREPGAAKPASPPPAPVPQPEAAPEAAPAPGQAQVIRVVPGSAIATPSAAARLARDGDTVEIAAAVYRGDVAIWTQNNLTLRGVGGRPHLDASGRSAEGKAIWVIKGNNTRIANMEFSGAHVGDRNGAGVRLEGTGLVVEDSYFHDNDMGILAGPNPASDVVLRNSEFARNRLLGETGGSIGHNIYIGAVNSLTVTGCKVHGAEVGHNVKSRARITTLVDNDIFDGPEGRSSYLVDLPAGGMATLKNNRLLRGTRPENTTLVSYGAEELLYDANRLTVIGNSFVNDYRNGIFINNHSGAPAEIIGNSFKGPGDILRGSGTIISNGR